MALMDCHFFSETLGMQTDMTVVMPQPTSDVEIGVRTADTTPRLHRCLWLLHGLSDDHTIWLRRTSIERYATESGWAVVMPNGHRGFYTDNACGGKYWTFLSEELPRLARSFFPLSPLREDNAIAGLSMGGYGAFKWGLRRPEFARAAASLSGALDMVDLIRLGREEPQGNPHVDILNQVFGDRDVAGSEDDLFAVARTCRETGHAPALLQLCGTADSLYPDNVRFRDFARRIDLPLTYREGPGGHDWAYWDREIQTVLTWLDTPHSQPGGD